MSSAQPSVSLKKKLPTGAPSNTTTAVPKIVVSKVRWKSDAEHCLLDWIESPGNFDRYRSAAVSIKGKKRTQGCTKVSVSQEISKYMISKGFEKTDQQVRSKIDLFLKSWKRAHQAKESTGFGVDLAETDVKSTVVNQPLKIGKIRMIRFACVEISKFHKFGL